MIHGPSNVKFIFIGVKIMKEMPGSVASGTHCTNPPFIKHFFLPSISNQAPSVTGEQVLDFTRFSSSARISSAPRCIVIFCL